MTTFIMWVCPNCGHTIQWPDPSTSLPNTICECGLPKFVTQMVRVWPSINNEDLKIPTKKTERNKMVITESLMVAVFMWVFTYFIGVAVGIMIGRLTKGGKK